MVGKIVIIGGTGQKGSGLATRLAMAGEHVIIASRSKEKCDEACKKLQAKWPKAKIEGLTYDEGVKVADILIIAVPMSALNETIEKIKPVLKKGIPVVDVTNPLEINLGFTMEGLTRTIRPWEGSAAEMVQARLPGNPVVAAWKNVLAAYEHDITKPIDCDVFIAGNDDNAKAKVSDLINKIAKERAIDLGGLDKSRLIEQLAPLLLSIVIKRGLPYAGLRLTEVK